MAEKKQETKKKKEKVKEKETKKEEETELMIKNEFITEATEEVPDIQINPSTIRKNGRKPVVTAIFARERVITEDSDAARDLYAQSRYGVILEDGKVQLSLLEALYLMERGRLRVLDSRKKEIDFHRYLTKAKKLEPNFWIRYSVFKDLRTRGYIVKTALKFGADFRVYDRGVKPGEDHARWVVYPVHEGSTLTWYEFAAKNRVAHSTKKRLLIGVVDDEGDVSYWEIKWIRP